MKNSEWILTNEKGGYCSGTSQLINSRKYHGILIGGYKNFKRTHLVASIEEKVMVDGREIFLDSNYYPNIIHPDGYRRIIFYFPRPFPVFIYSMDPGSKEGLLLKFLQMHPEQNFVRICYRNLSSRKIELFLRPKFTIRDHHRLNPPNSLDPGSFRIEASGDKGYVEGKEGRVFLFAPKAKIEISPLIYRNVTYPQEMMRGYDCVEDLLCPFLISLSLDRGEEFSICFGDCDADPEILSRECESRYKKFPFPFNHPLTSTLSLTPSTLVFGREEYLKILELCLQEFFAQNDLIAGFPWFSAWGRDAMISLEAFEFMEGGQEIIKKVLLKYMSLTKKGFIPNFVEGNIENYDSLDSSLWFYYRCFQYFNLFSDEEKNRIIGNFEEFFSSVLSNPPLPFHLDPADGLIEIEEGSRLALTWMDAKVFGEPVTPRWGKPVEINALWYNLLMRFLKIEDTSHSLRIEIQKLTRKLKGGLKKFWTGNSFADRIEKGKCADELRPNYLLALSLPENIFPLKILEAGYRMAKEKLFTPYGLRSLSPDHPSFKMVYMGNQITRDLAYHQGTVWVWLILPAAKVAMKIFRRNKPVLLRELNEMVSRFREEMRTGALASIPEIYDGGEPSIPKGAIAQCWSVSAVYIIEKLIDKLEGK